VTYQGKPLDRWPLPHGDATYEDVFHWRTVARWRGITWEAWEALDAWDQAGYLAEYAAVTKLQWLQAETDRKRAEARAKAARRKSNHGKSRV
jgi:hypothetical protein